MCPAFPHCRDSVHRSHRAHPDHCLPAVPALRGPSMCPAFLHCRDSVHCSRRVLLSRYSRVIPRPRVLQGPRLAVAHSPAAVRGFRHDSPAPQPQVQPAPLRPVVAYSKVEAGDCSRVLLAQHPLLESALWVWKSQASEVVRSLVAVRGFRRDLLAHYSLVVASPPLPALAPPVSVSAIVVRDCHHVHPVRCSQDARPVRSSRPAPAYPEAPAEHAIAPQEHSPDAGLRLRSLPTAGPAVRRVWLVVFRKAQAPAEEPSLPLQRDWRRRPEAEMRGCLLPQKVREHCSLLESPRLSD
jgi:hypothetical protein